MPLDGMLSWLFVDMLKAVSGDFRFFDAKLFVP